jgi:hypothetical protein
MRLRDLVFLSSLQRAHSGDEKPEILYEMPQRNKTTTRLAGSKRKVKADFTRAGRAMRPAFDPE